MDAEAYFLIVCASKMRLDARLHPDGSYYTLKFRLYASAAECIRVFTRTEKAVIA